LELAEIYTRLTGILRDVLNNDEVAATPELTAKQVRGWDSLANVRVVVAVEEAFGVRFAAREVQNLANVGELAQLTKSKLER